MEPSTETATRTSCAKCGDPIKRVDLHGTPFFTHRPRRDCLTWWHVDARRNLSHQAEPAHG